MTKALTPSQQAWVNRTFDALTPEERLAQLMVPMCTPEHVASMLELMERIPIGSAFVFHGTREVLRARIERLQEASKVPLVVASDLECGAGHIIEGAVAFPEPLAIAAANSDEIAYSMGKGAAIQGREVGIHWTYAPVVDVNLNPDNPIANTRSLGDDPKRIARLAAAITRGMQDHGLAACAKHFPGDGVDDLDQHGVTSINSLSRDEWHEVFGTTFGAAFAAGAWSTMIGHIALPAWDGDKNRLGAYRPATVSPRIVTELLRRELGFEGLVVTDDMNMGGVAGYMNRRDRTVEAIRAGCDMFLFPHLPDDYDVLVQAANDGGLPEERINDACRRVLELKARVGLDEGRLFDEAPAAEDVKALERASADAAMQSIVCVRDADAQLPLQLKPESNVLTVTLSIEDLDLPIVDEELVKRGFSVDHLLNPVDLGFAQRIQSYDAVFVNFLFNACYGTQVIRASGPQMRIFLGGFYTDHPCVVFTSFGSPYHLRMFSTLPNYINVHSFKPDCQRAAVAAWFGDIGMNGTSPVGHLERVL